MDSILSSIRSRKRDQLPALLFASVKEGRCGGLKAAAEYLLRQLPRLLFIAPGQRQGHHHAAFGEILEVVLAVKGLQRIAGIELPAPRKV